MSISQLIELYQWHHVTSDLNVADIISHGQIILDAKPSCWLSGPDFPQTHRCDWAEQAFDCPLSSDDPEVKQSSVCASLVASQHPIDLLCDHSSD